MQKKHKTLSRKLQFGGFDGSQLSASLDFPSEMQPKQYVIMSHCFTCSKQMLTTARLSRGLAQAGYAVLRFDFTGLGDSGGDFANTHFRSMIGDIECAAHWLASHYEPASVLIGHSMGGTASLASAQNASASLSALQSVITLASPSYPAHVLHHFGDAMPALKRGEKAQIMVAGRAYPVKPSFVEDVESYDMAAQMQTCELPILAVYAGDDELVEPQAAQQIVQYSCAKNALQLIDGANHLFSDVQHAEQVLSKVLKWIE